MHNYRKASRMQHDIGEFCELCREHKVREHGGRLECPYQQNYQVGKHHVCDRFRK